MLSIDIQYLADKLRSELHPRGIISLSDGELAVQTVHGFWLVVPSWNLDVAVGIIRDGSIEPWTNRVMLDNLRRGDRVINVGANFGYYAALAAQRVGPEGEVHAVEANPVVFPFLVKGTFWSGFPDIIRSYNFAAVGHASDGEELTFAFDPQFIGGGNLFSRARANLPYAANIWSDANISAVLDDNNMFVPRGLYTDVKVKGKALDSLFDGGVDLMLIDAEGAECFVIDGARNTIANSPDLKLILEWDPHSYRTGSPERRSSIENMWSFLLKDQGLSVSRIDPSSYSPLSGAVALVPITEDELYQTPHSDLLLHRPQQAKVRSTTQPPSIGTINRAP